MVAALPLVACRGPSFAAYLRAGLPRSAGRWLSALLWGSAPPRSAYRSTWGRRAPRVASGAGARSAACTFPPSRPGSLAPPPFSRPVCTGAGMLTRCLWAAPLRDAGGPTSAPLQCDRAFSSLWVGHPLRDAVVPLLVPCGSPSPSFRTSHSGRATPYGMRWYPPSLPCGSPLPGPRSLLSFAPLLGHPLRDAVRPLFCIIVLSSWGPWFRARVVFTLFRAFCTVECSR